MEYSNSTMPISDAEKRNKDLTVSTPQAKDLAQKRISTLERVREGLKADKRVFYAGEILHSPAGSWTETVDIITAPVKPIYDSDKLNELMNSMVMDIPRSAKDEGRHYSEDSDMTVGRLYFDEVLGTETKEIKTTIIAVEPEALLRAGIQIGESHKTRTEELKRRTWVRVYPDATVATLVAQYEQGVKNGTIVPDSTFSYLEHWISPDQLRKLKEMGSKGQKFRGFLESGKT